MSIDELKACVEGENGLKWIRGGGIARGWNNIRYKAGMSSKNVGSKALSMNVATIPPGGVMSGVEYDYLRLELDESGKAPAAP